MAVNPFIRQGYGKNLLLIRKVVSKNIAEIKLVSASINLNPEVSIHFIIQSLKRIGTASDDIYSPRP